uniref:type II toxin-antitoxin system RelE/ParE family toxin n=1 Tax=uncultured Sphingomonas sp. TaxID=158754 RepID=UPI0026009815|nr:type II toxin-antitoxin system RelE/ParE family toxin [uncultured Sphingomonas sp.]
MKRVRFRPAARADLARIAEEGRERWGREAARDYILSMRGQLARLAEQPGIGSDRSLLAPGLRKATVGSHHAFYRAIKDGIIVVRVLHPGMIAPQWIDEG